MSIATEIERLLQAKADLKISIEAKGVQIAEGTTLDDYPEAVDQIQTGGGGGGSVSSNAVNFFDYDGTIVESYTASEFASLTAMPSNPSHTGLTAQGWNWSLADAQAYVAEYGNLNIGQMYITESGDTEIYIELHEDTLSPNLGICPNGTVEIDWGDGSTKDTVTGASLTSTIRTQHHYATEGSYIIKLHVVDGNFGLSGGYSSGNNLFSYVSSIEKIFLGRDVKLQSNAFKGLRSLACVTIPVGIQLSESCFNLCDSLRYVTIPIGDTTIHASEFSSMSSLRTISMPKSITGIGLQAFYYCNSLAYITLSDSITNLGNSAFRSCVALTSITIPSNVTGLEQYCFYSCGIMHNIKLYPTTPPTVSNADVFSNLASDLVVYVPQGTLAAYQAASNYSGIASKMVEMP